ncbi:unnamed protein product [Gulo gulo]|uniref:Uncharacterized protein n=1 Tax=Gulo gulo TaxID=48420 RepID=A0A9X9LBX0_GULGU|nr:unnamed protein product [Gulo gulo]
MPPGHTCQHCTEGRGSEVPQLRTSWLPSSRAAHTWRRKASRVLPHPLDIRLCRHRPGGEAPGSVSSSKVGVRGGVLCDPYIYFHLF